MKKLVAFHLITVLLMFLLSQGLASGETKPFAFVAVGDAGCGCADQEHVARRMLEWYGEKPYQVVLMLGDNIYGKGGKAGGDRALFQEEFDKYYKPLIDHGVKFYAAVGNHDVETRGAGDEIADKTRFNILGDNGYYTFTPDVSADGRPLVTFYALNSSIQAQKSDEATQITWLSKKLVEDTALWKIPFFHHPIYAPGGAHDPEVGFRDGIENMLVAAGVRMTLAGHDHFYARMKPQKGIIHFISGGGGRSLMNPIKNDLTAEAMKSFHFLYVEVDPAYIHFWAIPASGPPIDQGAIALKEP